MRTQARQVAREAIYQACLLRFRPIMMTTMAALLSALPLMLGTGVGSELRHPWDNDGRRVDPEPVAHTVHHPVIYLAFDKLALRLAGTPDAIQPGIDPGKDSP